MARISQTTAARLCSLSRATIYRRVRRGAIPLGTDRRIDTDDLVRLGLLAPDWEARQRDHPTPEPVTLRELLRLVRESVQRQDRIMRLLQQCLDVLVSLRRDVPRNGAPC